MSASSFIRVAGWEDGQKFERDLEGLDRWTTQSADTLQITITDSLKVNIKQNPHSKHLGGYIWDTSIIMCKYFAGLPKSTFENKIWVELGAGIGFLGVVIEKLGATITVTDIPELVPVMETNIKLNNCTRATAKALSWGEDADTVTALSNPDYVVLCDCVYSEANVVALATTLNQICGPDTQVYSASELRNQDVYELFLTEVSKYFNKVRIEKTDLPKLDEVENINVFVLTKK
eukprot:Phypoly_transcript_15522.p1 GENE.Phypoly_transcript_15522~~Phypoly_transcript_15522.p1  ORF type:complete len:233 (+),score=21.87 Phypoly_transcript_15522:124-822(+)